MSNKYLPLAKLIEQGLQEGTVLNAQDERGEETYTWTVNGLYSNQDQKVTTFNPFYNILWRIVSTPPKKITFETAIQHGGGHNPQYVYLPEPVDFVRAIVTVEEKR